MTVIGDDQLSVRSRMRGMHHLQHFDTSSPEKPDHQEHAKCAEDDVQNRRVVPRYCCLHDPGFMLVRYQSS